MVEVEAESHHSAWPGRDKANRTWTGSATHFDLQLGAGVEHGDVEVPISAAALRYAAPINVATGERLRVVFGDGDSAWVAALVAVKGGQPAIDEGFWGSPYVTIASVESPTMNVTGTSSVDPSLQRVRAFAEVARGWAALPGIHSLRSYLLLTAAGGAGLDYMLPYLVGGCIPANGSDGAQCHTMSKWPSPIYCVSDDQCDAGPCDLAWLHSGCYPPVMLVPWTMLRVLVTKAFIDSEQLLWRGIELAQTGGWDMKLGQSGGWDKLWGSFSHYYPFPKRRDAWRSAAIVYFNRVIIHDGPDACAQSDETRDIPGHSCASWSYSPRTLPKASDDSELTAPAIGAIDVAHDATWTASPSLIALAADGGASYQFVARHDQAGAELSELQVRHRFKVALHRSLLSIRSPSHIVRVDWEGDPAPRGRVLGVRIVEEDGDELPLPLGDPRWDTFVVLPCSNGRGLDNDACAPHGCGPFGVRRGALPAADGERCAIYDDGICKAGACAPLSSD